MKTYGLCNSFRQVIKRHYILFLGVLLSFICACVLSSCSGDKEIPETTSSGNLSLYLNHSDSAKYVGMQTCASCHQSIYTNFLKTGMGSSFDLASKSKSSAGFSKSIIHDKYSNFHYQAYWENDSLMMKEFRLHHNDTVYQRIEKANYIIGSGQHTNSHMQNINGYVNQMPMTFYTQKKYWDLPPGFENGVNTRFSRKIGLECMSCHNAFPDFVIGSENKYERIPNGIDCERCHGPGSIHVVQRMTGKMVDTSKYIDYSIVNPAKLSIDAQFDICQRCHLQGNAVLKEGKSFYDFLPGKKLSEVMSVFLPKYKNADEEFIMASHADRLKQSACFIKSYEKNKSNKSLKPFKDALTCVTCHNPHVSVRETNQSVFNNACKKCHSQSNEQTLALEKSHQGSKLKNWTNCVSCHMPSSGSSDIPHVSVHDHYIRKPVSENEQKKIKTFLGLYAINEKNPDALTRARAYIQHYEKFEQKLEYLDSAEFILIKNNQLLKNKYALIHLYFLKKHYQNIVALVEKIGEKKLFDSVFTHQSYDNRDAWACYQISEAYANLKKSKSSLQWLQKSVKLAPFQLDFRNKYANALFNVGEIEAAIKEFEYIIQQNPKISSAYSNLGYLKMLQGKDKEAFQLYSKSEKLDPDNETLLLNLSAYYLKHQKNKMAVSYLTRVLQINPNNHNASVLLQQLN